MNAVNTILMMVLCTMIGFAIGNAWGKESMKRTMTNLMDQLIKGARNAIESSGAKKNKESDI